MQCSDEQLGSRFELTDRNRSEQRNPCAIANCCTPDAPRMTSFSLTMFGWLSTRSDATSRSRMHSSQLVYFFFIFLMATTSPLLLMPTEWEQRQRRLNRMQRVSE